MNLKRFIVSTTAGALLLGSLALPVLAGSPKDPADYNGLNHSGNASQLYLYEKTGDPDWDIVSDGAWGKLTFTDEKYSFQGHGLEPNTDYTLIRYQDPWPGSPVCLGADTSNNGGNLALTGDMQAGGPKVWLVLTSDVNCGVGMTGWNPTEYLFEYNTI